MERQKTRFTTGPIGRYLDTRLSDVPSRLDEAFAAVSHAFPSKRIDGTVTNLIGYEELAAPKATLPEDARRIGGISEVLPC